jgi:hypothetical protein
VAVHYAVRPYLGQPTLLGKDFNGDGIADLALLFGGGVRVVMGHGHGTLQTTIISYLGGGDGLPDLAVVNADARSVSILLNDGNWAP